MTSPTWEVDSGQVQVGPAAGELDQEHPGPGTDIEQRAGPRCDACDVLGQPAVEASQQATRDHVVDPAATTLEDLRHVAVERVRRYMHGSTP